MKYTIGEILQNRRVGKIGKFSTFDDMVKEFGEPSYIRHDGLAYYGNLVFQFMLRKKLILGISITNASKESRIKSGWGNNTVLKDFNTFSKLGIDEIHSYLQRYNITIHSIQNETFISGDNLMRYTPIDNKFFTIFEPKFEIIYHLKENRFYSIFIDINYRSKRRN